MEESGFLLLRAKIYISRLPALPPILALTKFTLGEEIRCGLWNLLGVKNGAYQLWRVRVNSVGGGGTDREEAPTQGRPRTDLVIWAAVPAALEWGLDSF